MKIFLEKLKNPFRWARSWFWVLYCGYPAKKLTVIGVTGTDGKTTVVNLIYEILRAAGYKTGMVSTVGGKYVSNQESGIRNQEVKIEMGLHVTTPDEDIMQRIFRQMVDAGCTHAVIEVTSHRLAQMKTEGYNVKIAVLTNITHEHLDYHGSMENYIAVKARLFRNVEYAVLPNNQYSIINVQSDTKIVKFSKTKLKKISPTLAGDYNGYNIAAAEAVAKILKIERVAPQVARGFSGVPGRREEIKMGQKFRAVVDFAHTPNGLESLLKSLKKETQKKLILVFGCTGERDKEKRPVMGEIADKYADVVIVTTDDQRNESQDEIYAQIISKIQNSGEASASRAKFNKIIREDDRDKAIEIAVKMAKPGDIVVAAGMGHETTQLIGKIELKRSDKEAFEKAIKRH